MVLSSAPLPSSKSLSISLAEDTDNVRPSIMARAELNLLGFLKYFYQEINDDTAAKEQQNN